MYQRQLFTVILVEVVLTVLLLSNGHGGEHPDTYKTFNVSDVTLYPRIIPRTELSGKGSHENTNARSWPVGSKVTCVFAGALLGTKSQEKWETWFRLIKFRNDSRKGAWGCSFFLLTKINATQ